MELAASSLFGLVVHPKRCPLAIIKKRHVASGAVSCLLGLIAVRKVSQRIVLPFTALYIAYTQCEHHLEIGLRGVVSDKHAEEIVTTVTHPFLRGIGVMIFCRCPKIYTVPLALLWAYPVALTAHLRWSD